MEGHDGRMVLCGSNGYDKKYYFNEEFSNLPESIKRQLQVMCVWFTEECGGILTLEFEEDGTLEFCHTTSEYDGYYDEIGADLKIKQYREEGQELLKALETYYKVFYLGEDVEDDEDSDDGDSDGFDDDDNGADEE
ncbi:DUF6145 family protein [Brotaphodocola sp.]|uniref:DUF6145 family protein n=1 Tax=Brotaphodocola sp. TaxID=3073577 RepID=UPI003D7E564D